MPEFTALPPLSLYVHVPWCVRKCPYCDFNSHQIRDAIPEKKYIDALMRDLERQLPAFWSRKINTIFIGGGTPSVLSPVSIDALLNGIRSLTHLSPNAEITMEANPGTLDNGKLAEFAGAGVNRLSIGIQSFNARHLQLLGRIHDAAQALNAFEAARKGSFQNINIDLMFALHEQTIEDALRDIEIAVELNPEHISYYHLTIEPNTFFYRYPPQIPESDFAFAILERAQALLEQHRYRQYEVSAYAKPGKQSRHNTNYWLFGDYVGIGAGAHGKISRADTHTVTRTWNPKHPVDYMQTMANSEGTASSNVLTEGDIVFEFLMNALRLKDGFELEVFEKNTGLPLQKLRDKLEPAIERQLVVIDETKVHTTPLGYAHLDHVLADML